MESHTHKSCNCCNQPEISDVISHYRKFLLERSLVLGLSRYLLDFTLDGMFANLYHHHFTIYINEFKENLPCAFHNFTSWY